MRPEDSWREFRPELLSRRGEWIGWGLTFLVGATWLVLYLAGTPVRSAVPVLAILLLLASLSISLGNWMDRRTLIRLKPEGVNFENGLRQVTLAWDEIRQVQVFPSSWGKKVRVIGKQAQFEFRTLGKVKLQGEVKGRMGFVEGSQILHTIIESGNLEEVQPTSGKLSDARYYYARE